MKIFKLLVLVLVVPFVVVGEDLEYDYVEDNYVKNNYMEKNYAEKNYAPKSRQSKNVRKTPNSTKKRNISKRNIPNLDYKKEPSGAIIGGGFSVGMCLLCIYRAESYNNISFYNGYNSSDGRYFLLSGINILGGYKWFFGKGGFGMRLYGDYNGLYTLDFQAHNFALNYDLLFNWVKTKPFKFGMILGIQNGVTFEDYNVCSECTRTFFSTTGNLGFRFVIYDKYAIEPLLQLRLSANSSQREYKISDKSTTSYYNVGEFLNFYTIASIRFVYTF